MSKNAATGGLALAIAVTLAVGGIGGYMFGVRSGQSTGAGDSAELASVNGAGITQNDLWKRLSAEPSFMNTAKSALEQMIDEQIVNQAAAKAGVKVSQADIDAEIKRLEEQVGGPDRLAEIMAQYGMSMPALEQQQRIRVALKGLLADKIQPTEDEMKAFFDGNSARFDQRQAHTRHILVATEDEAKQIKTQLAGGADFAALAKEKSKDPSVVQNSGDMGKHKYGNMVSEYDQVAFALKKGQLSDPVQSEHGFHIIQAVEDPTGQPPTYEGSKEQVRSAVADQKLNEHTQTWLDEQRKAANIKRDEAFQPTTQAPQTGG